MSGISTNTHSQEWLWSKQYSSTASTQVASIDLDANNNVYVSGLMNSTVDIGASSPIVKYGSSVTFFIARYSESGSYQWHRQIAGTGDITRGKLLIDEDDSLIFCAFYKGTCDSLPGVLPAYKSTTADVLLAKYSSNGKLAWSRRVAWGPADVRSQEFTVDPENNIYITGFSTDTIYFENNNKITTSGGKVINFIAKYSPQGHFLSVTKISYRSTNVNNNKFVGITAPNENEIYVGGFFVDSVSYGSIKLYSGGATLENSILVKIDENGVVNWMRMAGSINGNDRCYGVSTDIYGNVYMTGYISGSAIFDSTSNGSQNSTPLNVIGSYDMMIAKYNKNGTLQWKRNNGDTGEDIGYGIYISRNLLMYSGYYAGQVSFNNVTLNSGNTSNTNTGFFVYDTDGNPITASDIQGNGADRGTSITYNNEGITYIAGYFESTDLTIGTNVYNCGGTQDGFLAVYQNPFSVTFSKKQDIECYEDNTGQLIATTYFGSAPYTYSWSPNVTNYIDSFAYNLPAGTYSVTVTDSRDSVATTSIVLSAPPAINLSAVQSDVSCYPTDGISNNGSINLTVSGGVGGFTYNWQAISGSGVNATAEDQANLTAGIYAVYVTDNNNCEVSDTFYINQPDQIIFGQSIVTDESIPPGNDGEIDLTVTGGTPAYTYAWTGPSFSSTDEDIDELAAGSYQVVVHDSKSCISDTTFLVINNVVLIAYISNKTDIDCNGNNTGTATVSVLNGTGPYTYHWENNLGFTIDGDAPTIINLPADIYYVTVTDNDDMETATASVQLFEPDLPLTANIIATDVLCYGDMKSVADLTVNGGTLPYHFLWSNSSTEEDLLNIGYGSYFVTVTDNNGCTASDDVSLSQPPAMDIIITIDQPILCHDDFTGIVTATATGGTGTKTYIWDDPGNQTNQTATSLEAGTYHVTATDLNGCKITGQIQLLNPALLTLSESHTNVTCFGEGDGIINLSVSGGTPSYNYEWSNGRISQDIDNLSPGTFAVTVTDAHNCTAGTSIGISEPAELEITDVNISGNDVTVTITGGTPPYSYSLGSSLQNTTGVFLDVPEGTYNLSVTDANSCGPETVSGIVILPDAIDFYEGDLFRIYPNPSDGIFNIEVINPGVTEFRIQIYSTSGALLYDNIINQEMNSNKFTLDLSSELPGIYLMKINGITIHKRLIVQ